MITIAKLLEAYQVVQQTFAPLRLSRWQLMKLFATQIWREASFAAKIITVAVCLIPLLMIIARILRPRSLKRLGIHPAVKSKPGRMSFKDVLEETAEKVCQSCIYIVH